MASDAAQQEMQVLTSILSADSFQFQQGAGDQLHGQMIVPVNLSGAVKLLEHAHESSSVSVTNLPPISLFFSLPPNYPNDCPQVALFALWLTEDQVNCLHAKLTEMWKENLGIPVLFSWYQYIKESAFVSDCVSLDLDACANNPADDSFVPSMQAGCLHAPQRKSVTSRRYSTKDLKNMLLDYDRQCHVNEFQRSYVCCEVCFEEHLGSECVRFSPCDHAFCRECCKAHFIAQIGSGSVAGVACLASNCSTPPEFSILKQLVGEELFAKYESLALAQGLSTMLDVVYCPRLSCQMPVVKDSDSDTLATCSYCGLSFCVFCRRGYHGIAPCRIDDLEGIVLRYKSASDGEKAELEQRYGKKQLQNAENNLASEKWKAEHSKQCPSCHAPIERDWGCNRMQCLKCGRNFCWLCGGALGSSPYAHFADPFSPCFNRLFEGIEMKEDDDERNGGFIDFGFDQDD